MGSASRCISGARGCPTIRAGTISPARVKIAAVIISTPNDHFTATPHCGILVSRSRRVGGAGSCPTIGAGIISPASVQNVAAIESAPDDHFAPGPDRRVIASGSGRVGGAGGGPAIHAGIVSPAGVQPRETVHSPPDDHFATSPDCRVTDSARGRVNGASGCPDIIGTSVRPIRYCGKPVVGSRGCHYLCPSYFGSVRRYVRCRNEAFRQCRSGQTLGDHIRIVAQCCKQFMQHLGLFGVLRLRSISACNCSGLSGWCQ